MEAIDLSVDVLMESLPTIMMLGTRWGKTEEIYKYHLSIDPEGLQPKIQQQQ